MDATLPHVVKSICLECVCGQTNRFAQSALGDKLRFLGIHGVFQSYNPTTAQKLKDHQDCVESLDCVKLLLQIAFEPKPFPSLEPRQLLSKLIVLFRYLSAPINDLPIGI